MSRLKTFLLVAVSCILSSFVTAAVVLYLDVKPGTNTFSQSGDVVCIIDSDTEIEVETGNVPSAVFVNQNSNEIKELFEDETEISSVSAFSHTEETETVISPVESASGYYRLQGRDKYHVEGCRHLKGKQNVESVSQSDIYAQNLSPCKNCIK